MPSHQLSVHLFSSSCHKLEIALWLGTAGLSIFLLMGFNFCCASVLISVFHTQANSWWTSIQWKPPLQIHSAPPPPNAILVALKVSIDNCTGVNYTYTRTLHEARWPTPPTVITPLSRTDALDPPHIATWSVGSTVYIYKLSNWLWCDLELLLLLTWPLLFFIICVKHGLVITVKAKT